jgi:hypothetical protein
MALGKVERRHVTRIYFPALFKPQTPPVITNRQKEIIYDRCLRRAILDVLPEGQCRWPINYEAMMIQSRDKTGRFHYPSIDIPPTHLDQFADRLLAEFEEHPDFSGAFFVHELRGTKGATPHEAESPQEARDRLDSVLDWVDAERITLDDWHVDVGIEIRHERHVVQWLTSAHRMILSLVLPSLSEGQVSRLLRSPYFLVDYSAQLYDLAGFRVEPRSKGIPDRVEYINVYTTDKNVTYQLHQGLYSRRWADALLPANLEKMCIDMETFSRVLFDCGMEGQEGTARLELRVPLLHANDTLTTLTDEFIQQAVVTFPTERWW